MRILYRILRALWMALRGHRGQKDKAGKPYWHHLLTVAWIAYGLTHDPEAVVVGLLHDYYEDVYTGRIQSRFGRETAHRVGIVTRRSGESYEDFIGQIPISGDPVALAVKLADLLHNTEPGRMVMKDAESLKRSIQYGKAIERLVQRRLEDSRA